MTEAGPFAADFDFLLPADRIAQHPASPREAARLLHVANTLSDRTVADLPSLLQPGDLLVTNDTRVIPAQLTAMRGAARVGITLDRALDNGTWHALARNARRLHVGDELIFDGAAELRASVVDVADGGSVTLRFDRAGDAFEDALRLSGALALPPYIHRPHGPTGEDARDYQTVFAARPGAVAAPTAGLHFSPGLLARLTAAGVQQVSLTLHVGAGTFLPMRSERVSEHTMHPERGWLSPAAAARINDTRLACGRIVAVGTTCLRLLEAATDENGTHAFDGETDIFIIPGRKIRGADLLLTNFHLPRSTLFMLVCAFAGAARMKAAYAHAIEAGYRFYSYGDATLLERVDP